MRFQFTLVVKACPEFDDVTSAGKQFHVPAAATGNARSPTVDSHVGWNIQCRGRRWPQALSTRNPGDWLNGVSQVGRSKSRTHWYIIKDIRWSVRSQCRRQSREGYCDYRDLAKTKPSPRTWPPRPKPMTWRVVIDVGRGQSHGPTVFISGINIILSPVMGKS